METRAQLALFRPGPEVTALREIFAELLTDPANVHRISDLLSGVDNRYAMGDPDDETHPLVGRWVPDFSVANTAALQRIAELARDGPPLLVDLTESGGVAATLTDVRDELTVVARRPVGEVGATAVLVRPDGYVAWASSSAMPDADELHALRDALTSWFGI